MAGCSVGKVAVAGSEEQCWRRVRYRRVLVVGSVVGVGPSRPSLSRCMLFLCLGALQRAALAIEMDSFSRYWS